MSNGSQAPDNFDAFRHPKILFVEHQIQPSERLDFQQFELKTSRDMIVDLLAVSEETYSIDAAGAASATYLHYLGINWHVAERAPWLPAGYGSMEDFANFHEADRSGGGIFLGQAAAITAWGTLRWRHALPWIYNAVDTLSAEFTSPGLAGATTIPAAQPIEAVWDGVGEKTGLRRLFQLSGAIPANVAQAPIPPYTLGNQQNSDNLGDEPFRVGKFGLNFPMRDANAGNWLNDLRILNHYRMRVTPSIGDSWSDVPVPLIFYGTHMSIPFRVAYHRPEGGPIGLKAGQSIMFSFINYRAAGGNLDNIQVALIGRTAMGVGSVQ